MRLVCPCLQGWREASPEWAECLAVHAESTGSLADQGGGDGGAVGQQDYPKGKARGSGCFQLLSHFVFQFRKDFSWVNLLIASGNAIAIPHRIDLIHYYLSLSKVRAILLA